MIKTKFINFTIFIVLTLFLSSNAHSQDWLSMMDANNANIYDIKKNFDMWWGNRTPEKGSGYKQFQRWYAHWEPRCFPSGDLPNPYLVYEAMLQHNQNTRNSTLGSNWTPIGPTSWSSSSYNPGLGRINCVAVDPTNSNIVYVGTPSGGLWKSTNGGNNWFTNTDDLSVLGVSSIVIDPTNTNNIYIGTGDGDASQTYSIGILKSTDGGNSFTTTGLTWTVTQFRRISKILMHPSSSSTLIAATSNGIYKTTDSGANWTMTQSGAYYDLEYKPGDPAVVYTARNRTTDGRFYRSTDGGDSFTEISSGLPSPSDVSRYAIGVSAANSEYVYLLAGNDTDYGFRGIYRSTNGGTSFSTMSTTPNILGYSNIGSTGGGQAWYDLVMAVDPVDENTIYTGGINIWKSTNGGSSLTNSTYWIWPPTISGYSHADIHFLDFIGSTLWCGSDGGVFRTTNGGTNWLDQSPGLQITQFYKIGGAPSAPYLFYGGTQDNGSNRFRFSTFTHVYGADGGECAINYNDTNIVFVETQNGGILRSTNSGNNFTGVVGSISETGAFVTPFEMSPVTPTTLYAGFDNIWKTTNNAATWTKISTFPVSGKLNTISISPSSPSTIYCAKGYTIYKTTNDGGAWTNITSGLPTATISYIDVSNTDPNKVWITFSGYTAGQKVYRSTNGGTSWTNYSGSLPNIPVNCVVYRNSSPDGVYIGTDVGVYYRTTADGDWIAFSTGLPNVIVNELEIHYGVQKLRAATFGRGLWESPLDSTVGVDPISSNIPEKFSLYQNYPNPFNPNTTIRYDIVNRSHVTLLVYDITGKLVRTLVNEVQATGERAIVWDGRNDNGESVGSGIYFYELTAGEMKETKKMILVK